MSTQNKKLQEEIRKRDREFISAYNSGDPEKLAELYDDNCSLMPAGMEPIHDKKSNQRVTFNMI